MVVGRRQASQVRAAVVYDDAVRCRSLLPPGLCRVVVEVTRERRGWEAEGEK